MPYKNHFWFFKELKRKTICVLLYMYNMYICIKTFRDTEKGSVDLRGSLWSHIDKYCFAITSFIIFIFNVGKKLYKCKKWFCWLSQINKLGNMLIFVHSYLITYRISPKICMYSSNCWRNSSPKIIVVIFYEVFFYTPKKVWKIWTNYNLVIVLLVYSWHTYCAIF